MKKLMVLLLAILMLLSGCMKNKYKQYESNGVTYEVKAEWDYYQKGDSNVHEYIDGSLTIGFVKNEMMGAFIQNQQLIKDLLDEQTDSQLQQAVEATGGVVNVIANEYIELSGGGYGRQVYLTITKAQEAKWVVICLILAGDYTGSIMFSADSEIKGNTMEEIDKLISSVKFDNTEWIKK